MKCREHNKDVVGSCQWCGQPLCRMCVTKSHANKLYCKNCSQELGPIITRIQRDKLRKEREREQQRAQYRKLIEGE